MTDDVKARPGSPPSGQAHHVRPLSPERDALAIEFPRVEGYGHVFAGDADEPGSPAPRLPKAIDTNEVPLYESPRVTASTRDVDFWTAKAVHAARRCHLGYVIMDTTTSDLSTVSCLDSDPHVVAFVKNAGLGFSIPHTGQGGAHEYQPDFLARLKFEGREVGTVLLETNGRDAHSPTEIAAAQRWVAAINRDGRHGRWTYRIVTDPVGTPEALRSAARDLAAPLAIPWRVALQRFVASVRTAYGSRFDRVVLYGSRARGDAELDSDVDALVVLDDCANFWAEHRRIGDLAIRASEGAETIVSAMPIGRRDFEQQNSPLLLNVRREGVQIA
jgi:predicted nucleotidyltransferase